MKDRPILFSAPMVRALLAGTKTQTRRSVKPRHDFFVEDGRAYFEPYVYAVPEPVEVPCPYGAPGDRLWVRETHAQFVVGNRTGDAPQCVAYRASCEDDGFDYVNNGDEIMRLKVTKWTPAIHMPHWASRLTLEVTNVRVERVQDISGYDVIAEGIGPKFHECNCEICRMTSQLCPATESSLVLAFADLWQEINGADSWKANPWVWVVGFQRIEAPR